MKVASILGGTLSNGDGVRTIIFFQGCSIHCNGCFNEHTWDFSKGIEMSVDEIISKVKEFDISRKITLSGGNPLEQDKDEFIELINKLKNEGFNIWCYTGFDFDFCLQNFYEQIEKIDILVDGKFKEDLYSPDLKFVGSSNQKIIDVQETLKTGTQKLHTVL